MRGTIMSMVIVALIVLGLILGSFVNALVWRLYMQSRPTKKGSSPSSSSRSRTRYSVLRGRSMCPACRHELGPADLVPVVSWLILKGKCRYCSQPISWQYPLVELLTAVLFVVSYFWWPLGFTAYGTVMFGVWLLCLVAFMALAVYDLRWFLLPDRIVYPLISLSAAGVAMHVALFGGGVGAVATAGWGVLFTAGLFDVIYVFSHGRWIGFGDVKLGVALGLLVGGPLKGLLLVFVASLLGSLVAIPLLAQGRARPTTQLPFGPFLLGAAIIVMLAGNQLANWYLSIFR